MTSIAVPIMHRATRRITPDSYPQCAQSTQTCTLVTGRASHTGVTFTPFAVDHAQPFGLIFQACTKLAPSGVMHGLGHTSFGKLGTRDIPHRNQLCPCDDFCRGLLCPVFAGIGNLGVEAPRRFFLWARCARASASPCFRVRFSLEYGSPMSLHQS